MKTLTVIAGVALAMSLSTNVLAQEAKDEIKTIEKKITITDDGKRIVETTIDGETTVDTLAIKKMRGPRGEMRMKMLDGDFPMRWIERHEMDFDVEIEGDSSNVFVIRHPGGLEEYQFVGGPNFGKHNVHVRDLRGNTRSSDRAMMDRPNRTLIDLNDPRITSFERETLKDGSEKITIIRKAPKKKGNKK